MVISCESSGYDLEARIAQALQECGLGEKEIQQVASEIRSDVEFLAPNPEINSSFWDFKGKLERVVKTFSSSGLTRDRYVMAALERPQLFYQSPDTIGQHIHWTQELEKREIIKIPDQYGSALEWLLKAPGHMTYSNDNYKLRFYYAKLLDKPSALANLTKSKKEVISELKQVVGDIFKVVEGKILIDFDKLRLLYQAKYGKDPSEGAYHTYLWGDKS